MHASDIYTPGAVSTSELASAIAGLLSRFACRQRTRDAGFDGNLIHGVSVMGHAENPHLLRFDFITAYDEHVSAVVDLRAVTREYMDELVAGIREQVDRHRSRRRPIEIRTAVRQGVLH